MIYIGNYVLALIQSTEHASIVFVFLFIAYNLQQYFISFQIP